MPLRATIEGQEVIAPLLDDTSWEALRQRVSEQNLRVTLPCCDVEGYLRRSKHGTKHFAHKQTSANCAARGETLDHLRAKAEIVEGCRVAGYAALTEVAGEDWRADVLATRGGARVAFEVQWSFLRLDDALLRQRRYERDGVRGCWFFRRPPAALDRASEDVGPDLEARRDLPLFHLYANADATFDIALNNRLHPLREFVVALLRGRVRFCETARAAGRLGLRAAFFDVDCPACGQRSQVYFMDTTQTAACGLRFKPDGHWLSPDFAFHPATLRALEAHRQSERGRRLRMGAIRPRGQHGLTFGCPACDTLFDGETLEMALYGARRFWEDPDAAGFDVTFVTNRPLQGTAPHWCYPANGRFCCETTG